MQSDSQSKYRKRGVENVLDGGLGGIEEITRRQVIIELCSSSKSKSQCVIISSTPDDLRSV